MASIDLSESHRTMLQTLVDLYRDADDEHAITAKQIAAVLQRHPGTIHNQMQTLKSLQLVKSLSGLHGGYKPTSATYHALDIHHLDHAIEIPLEYDGKTQPDALVQEITLTNVHHPDRCRAELRFQEAITDYHHGATLTVGPTPVTNLRLTGTIHAIDTTHNRLVLAVDDMRAPVSTNPEH